MTSKQVACNRRHSNRRTPPSVTQKNFVHLLLCLHNYPVYSQLVHTSTCYSKELCSSVTMSSQLPCLHNQLVHTSTCYSKELCSSVTMSSITLSSQLTCSLVYPFTKICSSVTMSFIYPVYSQVASCLNKGIYIYIIRRQKSVKFNYFSNLPICRKYANSLNRRKLLICRATSQSIDLHMITKAQNQAI